MDIIDIEHDEDYKNEGGVRQPSPVSIQDNSVDDHGEKSTVFADVGAALKPIPSGLSTAGNDHSDDQMLQFAGKTAPSAQDNNQIERLSGQNATNAESDSGHGKEGEKDDDEEEDDDDSCSDENCSDDEKVKRLSSKFFKKDHSDPVLITQQAHMRTTEHISDTSSYINLVQFTFFLAFYCVVLYNQIAANPGAREVKAALVDSLFSHGGEINDWTMMQDKNKETAFNYGGDLTDPLSNGDPVQFFSDGSNFLGWLKHDILNVIWDENHAEETIGTEFLHGNKVVGGVMLTQTRAAPTVCKKSTFFDLKTCQTAEVPLKSYDPFGVDLTFVESSDLFVKDQGEISDYYQDDQLSEGMPYAFFADQQNPNDAGVKSFVSFGSRPEVFIDDYPSK